MSAKLFLLIIFNAFLLVTGQVFWKTGIVVTAGAPWWRFLFAPWTLAGFAAFGLAAGIWFYIIARIPLSQALPVQSIAFVFGALAGVFFFHEGVSLARWIGIALIFSGIYLVAR